MRGVDLTPPEERRGSRAPTRTGGMHNLVLVGLGLALLAVIVTAFTSKQVSGGKADVSRLEQELEQATARAQALKPFADFRAVQQQRSATVSSLAQSRFDWERVIRELALVLPDDVWLVNLTGTVLPDVEIENGAGLSTRDSVAGPALEVVGCAPSQDSVAAFVAALEDIDGVTRVGLTSSKLPEESVDAASSGDDAGDEDCRTRDFIAKFEIVAAFDAVPIPPVAGGAPGVPAPLGGSEDAGQLADAQTQQATATSSAAEQTGQAQNATQTYLPGN
jgi:Tfp pilus assembly protein PilN